jgi:hypothetical protein
MKIHTKLLVGAALLAGTIFVPTGTATAAQGCHRSDILFDYSVNYPDNARFLSIDKNGDGRLCIRHNDPKYDGNIDTIKVYDNSTNPNIPW